MIIRVLDKDLPEPGAQPEALEPELAALLARHIQRSTKTNPVTGRAPALPCRLTASHGYRHFCWDHGFDDICVSPEGIDEH